MPKFLPNMVNHKRRKRGVELGLCGWCRHPRETRGFLCDLCAFRHNERQREKSRIRKAKALNLEPFLMMGG